MTTHSDDTNTISNSGDVPESFIEPGAGFYPFSQVPVWITLNASANAIAVYVFLWTYTSSSSSLKVAFPSRETIAAAALKTKQARTVDRYIAELEHIGALIKKQRRSSGNLKINNIYRLSWSPPPEFSGPVDRKQWEDMGAPLPEIVPIYKNQGDKKPAYTVVRFCALRDDQEKHTDDDNPEMDKTQNPRSLRSASERTTMCAKTHPGSAQKRTGTRSKPPISKTNPNPNPPLTPPQDVDDTARSRTKGGEDGDTNTKSDGRDDAVALVRSVVSTDEMGLIAHHRRRIELADLVSTLLTSGVSRTAIASVLSRDRSGLGDIVSGLIARLKGFESEPGPVPQDDPFVRHDESDGSQSSIPKWCGRCWSGPRRAPQWRHVFVGRSNGHRDEVGDMCTCHPQHPQNLAVVES